MYVRGEYYVHMDWIIKNYSFKQEFLLGGCVRMPSYQGRVVQSWVKITQG